MPIAYPARIQKLERYSERFEAYRLPAKDCDILFAMYPAGSDIKPHEHNTENWGIITKGELVLTMDGKEQRFGPGDWYHIPRYMRHAARFEKETEEIEFWFKKDA